MNTLQGKGIRIRDLIKLLGVIYKNKKKLKEVQDELSEKTDEAILEMEECEFRTLDVPHDSGVVTATLVTPTTVDVDWTQLRELIGEHRFNLLLESKPSMKLLEDAVARGLIDEAKVAHCSKIVPRKSYIRFTEKLEIEEDEKEPVLSPVRSAIMKAEAVIPQTGKAQRLKQKAADRRTRLTKTKK